MPVQIPFTPFPFTLPPTQPITATPSPFPARNRQAAGLVNGVRTDVSAMYFADKIVVTITQEGRLAHWVHVSLDSSEDTISSRRTAGAGATSSSASTYGDEMPGAELLPMPHLTATTVLGGATGTERDTLGRLYATQIASAIVGREPGERRLLVVGLGLKGGQMENGEEAEREGFVETLGLVLGCL